MREYSRLPNFHGPLAVYLNKFLAEKHAVGFRYQSQTVMLQIIDRYLQDAGVSEPAIPRPVVDAWTAKREGEQCSTREWRVSVMREFTRFLQRQGIAAYVPPDRMGRRQSQSFTPYIFTHAEIRALMAVIARIPGHHNSPHRHHVLPLIFHLLYGCGLRLGEVLPLRRRQVDVAHGILVLRDAKGHQDRLVPLAPALTRRLQSYARLELMGHSPDAIAFPAPDGGPYSKVHMYALFRRALWAAGISHGGRGRGPRLHDLRHTFAVHRLMAWYRAGVDINAALPILATYMGHRTIEGTQCYLRLTAELHPDLVAALDARYGHLLPGRKTS